MKRVVKKLAKMSAGEIGFRVKQKVTQEADYLRKRVLGPQKPKPLNRIMSLPADTSISKWLRENQPLHFFALADDREVNVSLYENTHQKHHTKAINDADALLHNRFHLLGLDFDLGVGFSWTADPVSGKEYPQGYFTKLEIFESEKVGADIKYVWELNRHQFLIELAKAFYISGDNKYAEKIKTLLESWIEQNPFKHGVNWTSALETAVRIYAWTWSFYFTRESAIWDTDFSAKFFRSLDEHAEFTEENLSHYFSPYNHLIGEIAALSFLGTAFPFFKKAKIWREKYWAKMESELQKQYYSDGLIVEQATYYHHFTTGFYLQLALLRKQNDHPVNENTWQFIERALDIALYMTKPDGTLPMIGDIDSARSVYFYRPERMWDLRGFQAVGAIRFKRTDMKYVAGGFPEEALWLLGRQGYNTFQTLLARPATQTSRHFKHSGYTVMRNGWHDDSDYLCFDCGEIADGLHSDETPSVAHGHSDALSFDLSVAGRPFIIDPGFYTYNGPLEWHRYFRSGKGHNTIEIDGACQGKHEGRMGWSGVSNAQIRQYFSNQSFDYVDGGIDGFAAPKQHVAQRRQILYLKSGLWFMIDTLSSDKAGQLYNISSYLHFVPGKVELNNKQSGVFCRTYPDIGLQILAAGDEELSTTLHDSAQEDDAQSGWICRGYGYREPAAVAEFRMQGGELTHLVTTFFPENSGDKPDSQSTFFRKGEGLFELQRTDGRHLLILRKNEQLTINEPCAIKTDAEMVYLHFSDTAWQQVYLVNASFLKLDGKEIYRQNKKSPYVLLSQNDGNPEVTYKISEV